MKTLWLMCGLPGSGKSTWLKNNIKDKDKIISRDQIRFSLLVENDEYFDKEHLVWQEFIRSIREKLNQYEDVFVDATHLNEKSRNRILHALNINTDAINVNCIAFDVDLKTCRKRNNKRVGRSHVPDNTLIDMNKFLAFPTFYETYQYNKIYYIDEDGEYVEEVIC